MKNTRLSRLFFGTALLFSAFSLVLVSCEEEAGPSVCIIEVVDSAGSPVEGATVYVNANSSSAIIDGQTKTGEISSEEVTGSDGRSTHSFKVPGKEKAYNLEAVLDVYVIKPFVKDTIKDTLTGRGSVHIYPDKTVKETITVRR